MGTDHFWSETSASLWQNGFGPHTFGTRLQPQQLGLSAAGCSVLPAADELTRAYHREGAARMESLASGTFSVPEEHGVGDGGSWGAAWR